MKAPIKDWIFALGMALAASLAILRAPEAELILARAWLGTWGLVILLSGVLLIQSGTVYLLSLRGTKR